MGKITTVRFRDQDGFLHLEACGESWEHSEKEAEDFLEALKKAISDCDGEQVVMVEPEPEGDPADGEWDTVIHRLSLEDAMTIMDTLERGIKHMKGKWA